MTLVEQSATDNANLKRRLARGPEYREDKTPDGIEIWPTLTRSEIAEVMAEAAVRIDILEAEAQCDEEYQELIKARVRSLEAELEKAREALEPFSRWPGDIPHWDDNAHVWTVTPRSKEREALTFGHFRRAREVFRSLSHKEG